MNTEEIISVLYHIIDVMRYYERINKLPECNDCLHKLTCKYAPEAGQTTRINCPLWEGKKHD